MAIEKVTVETEAENIAENESETIVLIEGEETADEMEQETADEKPSDMVTIAAIEADKEIQIAEIAAEIEVAKIEAESERESTWQEQIQELRTNITELAMQIAELAKPSEPMLEQVELIQENLTEAAALETVAEIQENLTPQFTLAPTSETVTEVILENGDEKPVVASATTRSKRRLI